MSNKSNVMRMRVAGSVDKNWLGLLEVFLTTNIWGVFPLEGTRGSSVSPYWHFKIVESIFKENTYLLHCSSV